MPNQVLIVHGWSDNADSFRPLKDWLISQGRQPTDVFLGNYESMQDDVTFDDLAAGLQARLETLVSERRISLAPFSLDLIVHSTGAPVVRHWLHYYLSEVLKRVPDAMSRCPIKRLVMLAPANFGSRLAAQGKTPLAKLFKGGVSHGFETGKLILGGLELGSPDLWRMAHDDLFAAKAFYPAIRDQGPFVFVLSGTATYGELQGFVAHGATEDGSDGTVRASAASLDSIKLMVDYRQPQGRLTARRQLNDPFAFKLVEGKNHSEIVPRAPIDRSHPTLGIIDQCFAVGDSTAYRALGNKFAAENQAYYQRQRALPNDSGVHAYQQFVMHLIDEMGNDVPDYRVDFHVIDDSISVSLLKDSDGNLAKLQQYQDLTVRLQRDVIVNVEPHTVNPSYRTFFVNIDALQALQVEIDKRAVSPGKIYIAMNIDAVGPTANLTYNTDDLQYIPVRGTYDTGDSTRKASFFMANTTTLVEISISRLADDKVFGILFD
jgi:hypothetical protein